MFDALQFAAGATLVFFVVKSKPGNALTLFALILPLFLIGVALMAGVVLP